LAQRLTGCGCSGAGSRAGSGVSRRTGIWLGLCVCSLCHIPIILLSAVMLHCQSRVYS
jgi:hypothetical protein